MIDILYANVFDQNLFISTSTILQCELIEYHGYPCETTHVTTEDGYILQVDRVPYGIHDNVSDTDRGNGTSIRHPVLLVPAIFTTSDVYFLNFPWQSLGKCQFAYIEGVNV
ncbi:hypothetical protein HPB49_020482 [Dermacentor silvarum]|uniref:Uncharacterized protein n=1 Tax=Dermacentor silvarum TaxID=543639 RepID=A0ACB8C597_DERSI|nr:hypothetical protein HPB49_020482 [Dermacentor silvarum]